MERETKKSKKSKKDDEDFDFEVLKSYKDLNKLLKNHPDQREIILKGAMERFEKIFKSTTQLIEVSEEVLIDHMVNTVGEFKRIVKNMNQFLCLLKSFEGKAEPLMKALFGDFSRLVKKNRDLVDLLKGISEAQKRETLIFVGKNDEHFKRLLVVKWEQIEVLKCVIEEDGRAFLEEHWFERISFNSLIEIRKQFPEFEDVLAKLLLKGENFSKKINEHREFSELLQHFTKYEEEFVKAIVQSDVVFLKVFSYGRDLLKLAKAFPKHCSFVMERVLAREEDFERLIFTVSSLDKLLRQFESFSEQIMQQAFRKDKKYVLRSTEKLLEICILFPDYSEELVRSLASEEKEYYRLCKDPNDVINVMKCVTEECGKVILEDYLFERISFNSLIEIRKQFPNYEDILAKLLLKGENISKKMSDHREFSELLQHFAKYEEDFVKYVVGSDEAFPKVFRDEGDVLGFAGRFPNYSNLVMERVLAREEDFERLIFTVSSLDKLLGQFESFSEQIMQQAFRKDKKYVLKSVDDCLNLMQRFPDYRRDLLSLMEPPDLFYQAVRSIEDLEKLTKAFPDHSERFVDALLSSPQSFTKVASVDNLMRALDCFPRDTDTRKIITFAMEHSFEHIVGYSSNQGYIHRLAERYTEFEDQVCLKILKDSRQFSRLVHIRSWVLGCDRNFLRTENAVRD